MSKLKMAAPLLASLGLFPSVGAGLDVLDEGEGSSVALEEVGSKEGSIVETVAVMTVLCSCALSSAKDDTTVAELILLRGEKT